VKTFLGKWVHWEASSHLRPKKILEVDGNKAYCVDEFGKDTFDNGERRWIHTDYLKRPDCAEWTVDKVYGV
jgi:hypothetical protein